MNIENERAAFEAWLFKYYPKAEELGIVYRPNENLYEHRQTQIRWIVCQVAKAQAELEIEQAKQSKIDELQKRVDAVKQLIEEYRDPSTEDKTFQHALSIAAYELEQALKGNN